MTERPDGAPNEPREPDEPGTLEAETAETETPDAEPAEAQTPEPEPADDEETQTIPVPVMAPPPPAPSVPVREERVARRPDRAPVAPPPPSPSEQAVHITDRASKLFVIGSVLVFLLIILNGVLFGVGGALSPGSNTNAAPEPDRGAQRLPCPERLARDDWLPRR